MQRWTRRLWQFLTSGSGNVAQPKRQQRTARRRLELEYLEDRSLLSANFSGVITGSAFLDSNGNHVRDANELAMAGVPVKLSGTTGQNVAVSLAATTNINGTYAFNNVLPGTYTITGGPLAALVNTRAATTGSFTLAAGQSLSRNLAFTGQLNPSAISIAEFLTTSTGISYNFGSLAVGPSSVNYRPDNAPVVAKALSPVAVAPGSTPTNLDLAGSFSDPDITNSIVTFNVSDGTKTLAVQMQLLDKAAPQTVANFFDYITAHAFDSSIFHRLQKVGSGLAVLQGGAITLNGTGNGFQTIPILSPSNGSGGNAGVPNEFSAANSNTFGTIAMAQSAGNVNSATDQFFFNTGNNASALDSQKFVVFGKVLSVSNANLTELTTATTGTITIPSSVQAAFPTVAFTDPSSPGKSVVPLRNYTGTGTNFPTDATRSNFQVINSITINKRDEFLTYSIQSNSNAALVTPTIKNEWLTLTYTAGKSGTADIVVVATDRYGATVTQTLHVTVGTPPVISSVAIAPNSTTSATSLTATPASTDPNGLTVTYTYQWQLNGVNVATTVASGTSQTLTLSQVTGLKVGDKLTVLVTPHDSAPFSGTAVTSNTETVATLTPAITFS